MDYQAVLEIKDLQKKFKGFRLDIPELKIPKGFATALIGENGAGKSTLINVMAGVRLDYKGSISYFGGETDEKIIRENIGYTGTGNYFLPRWTVGQVAVVSSLLFEQFSKERYEELCKELGVEDKKKTITKLSDGMRMKVTLAAVWARKTKLLIMDEPASPLDPLMRDHLCSMIRNYLDEGEDKSVLFSTHNISDMESVTDYAVIMDQGKVIEQGFVEDLKEKYILVKGETVDAKRAKEILFSFRENAFGFEGLCLCEHLDALAGMDISTETPTLHQISVAVMQHYSKHVALRTA